MLEIALKGQPEFAISRIEMDRKDISYTIDTLRQFREYEQLKDAQLYLILGMDNINELHLWKDPELIMQLVKIVVLRRPGARLNEMVYKYRENFILLDAPTIDISSTSIRKAIKSGEDVSALLPAGVLDFIHKQGLYI